MLPVEQKPHEILQSYRFDFPAQALDRVAMNAREQMPFAPFFYFQSRRELAAQHVTFALQLGEGLMDFSGLQRERFGNRG
ncbi:hypothetical protein D3C81_1543750 [compost metagenome]